MKEIPIPDFRPRRVVREDASDVSAFQDEEAFPELGGLGGLGGSLPLHSLGSQQS